MGGHRLYCSTFPPWLTELEREVKFIEFGLVYIYTGDCPRRTAALHRLVSHVHGPRPPGRVASRGAHHRGGEHHKPKQFWHPRPGLQQPRPLVGTRKLHQRGWMANREEGHRPQGSQRSSGCTHHSAPHHRMGNLSRRPSKCSKFYTNRILRVQNVRQKLVNFGQNFNRNM